MATTTVIYNKLSAASSQLENLSSDFLHEKNNLAQVISGLEEIDSFHNNCLQSAISELDFLDQRVKFIFQRMQSLKRLLDTAVFCFSKAEGDVMQILPERFTYLVDYMAAENLITIEEQIQYRNPFLMLNNLYSSVSSSFYPQEHYGSRQEWESSLLERYQNLGYSLEEAERLAAVEMVETEAYETGSEIICGGMLSALSDAYVEDLLNIGQNNLIERYQNLGYSVEEARALAQRDLSLEHLNVYNQTAIHASNSIISSNRTVEDTACGLSVYMAARYRLTGNDTDYMTFCDEAQRTGAYNGNGSDFNIFANDSFYSENYGVSSQLTESNYDSYLSHLRDGDVISVLVSNGERNVESGGFNGTSGGHYILLTDYDQGQDNIYVYNPTGANTGWHDRETIENYVVDCSLGSWDLSSSNK